MTRRRDAVPIPAESPGERADAGADRWVDVHGDALYRYALFRVGDPDAAADLVQETFLAAVRAHERFAGRSGEKTWLLGILKHKIADHFRRVARERRVYVDGAGSDPFVDGLFDADGEWRSTPLQWDADPAEVAGRREFWEAFYGCLSGLPDRHRIAFLLAELNGAGTAQVCSFLDLTPDHVWVILHRARMRLRNCLERSWFAGREG